MSSGGLQRLRGEAKQPMARLSNASLTLARKEPFAIAHLLATHEQRAVVEFIRPTYTLKNHGCMQKKSLNLPEGGSKRSRTGDTIQLSSWIRGSTPFTRLEHPLAAMLLWVC